MPFLLALLLLVGAALSSPDGAAAYPHVLVPTNRSCSVAADCLAATHSWCDAGQACLRQRCHLVPNYPCPYFQRCDAEARRCVPRACTRQRDCDDGLFCNGEEACVNHTCTSDFAHDCTGGTCSEQARTCSLPLELQLKRRQVARTIYQHGLAGYIAMRSAAVGAIASAGSAALSTSDTWRKEHAFATPTEAPTAAPTGLSNNAVVAIVCSVVVVALVVFILLIIALISR